MDPTVQMSIDKRIFFIRYIINYNEQIVKNGPFLCLQRVFYGESFLRQKAAYLPFLYGKVWVLSRESLENLLKIFLYVVKYILGIV